MLSRVSGRWSLPVACIVRHACAGKSRETIRKVSSVSEQRRLPESAVIIPHDVQNATPDTFLPHLSGNWRGRSSDALILVTPSFAQWLNQDHTFLQSVAERLFSDSELVTMRIVAAVVDKLPVSIRGHVEYNSPTGIISRKPASGRPQTASEGIAYTFLDPHKVKHAYPSSLQEQEPSSRDPSEAGSISFRHHFKPMAAPNKIFTDDVDHTYILRLPLANTVFQTGRRTTMVSSNWTNRDGQVTCQAWKHIDHITVMFRLGSKEKRDEAPILSTMKIPLMPLTLPRKIEEGMGNIVRRITGSNDSSITASTELEEVVPQFFEATGQTPQSITAWALVMPRTSVDSVLRSTMVMLDSARSMNTADAKPSAESWKALWNNPRFQYSQIVERALAHGARLHRVLSGGGGWGKKAGLLALDPEIAYDDSLSSSEAEKSDDPDIPMNLWGSAHELVKPEEFIQFFTLPPPSIPLSRRSSRLPGSLTGKKPRSWEFGTLPSTMDAMPASVPEPSESDTSKVSFLPDYFGALTEGALTIVEQTYWKSLRSVTVHATKIDVPYTRFHAAIKVESGRHIAKRRSTEPALETEPPVSQIPEKFLDEGSPLVPLTEKEERQKEAADQRLAGEAKRPESNTNIEGQQSALNILKTPTEAAIEAINIRAQHRPLTIMKSLPNFAIRKYLTDGKTCDRGQLGPLNILKIPSEAPIEAAPIKPIVPSVRKVRAPIGFPFQSSTSQPLRIKKSQMDVPTEESDTPQLGLKESQKPQVKPLIRRVAPLPILHVTPLPILRIASCRIRRVAPLPILHIASCRIRRITPRTLGVRIHMKGLRPQPQPITNHLRKYARRKSEITSILRRYQKPISHIRHQRIQARRQRIRKQVAQRPRKIRHPNRLRIRKHLAQPRRREQRSQRRITSGEQSQVYRQVMSRDGHEVPKGKRWERELERRSKREEIRTPVSEARGKEMQEWRKKRGKLRELLDEVSGWLQ